MSDLFPYPRARRCAMGFLLLIMSSACREDRDEQPLQLDDLELTTEAIPDSPTNAYADRPEAAALGQRLFFDPRLSSDGTVACVDCHDPDIGFSDTRRFSEGIAGLDGRRHAMPLTTAAMQPFLLWDGRADTVWRQPLLALENEREMNFARTSVALYIAEHVREDYEAVFGPLPDLEGVVAQVRPGDEAWDALPPEKRDAVQRVFVNVGKAIEAYERLLVCTDTRFDRWVRGDIELAQGELEGARQFVQSGCVQCHSGPAFSDGEFHNLGLVREGDEDVDTGREAALADLFADELNGAGKYSDDPDFGAKRLLAASAETRIRGAFRTASLRGVTQRPRFGHRGQETDLEEFIQDTYNRNGRGRGRGGNGNGNGNGNGADIVGEIDPILDDVNAGGDDAESIVEFLRTLECPTLPPELLQP